MDEMWNYMPELLPFHKSKTLSIIVFYIYYIVLTIAIISLFTPASATTILKGCLYL